MEKKNIQNLNLSFTFPVSIINFTIIKETPYILACDKQKIYLCNIEDSKICDISLENPNYNNLEINTILFYPDTINEHKKIIISIGNFLDIWVLNLISPFSAKFLKSIPTNFPLKILSYNEKNNIIVGTSENLDFHIYDLKNCSILSSIKLKTGKMPISAISWLKNSEDILLINQIPFITIFNIKESGVILEIENKGNLINTQILDSTRIFDQNFLLYVQESSLILYNISRKIQEIKLDCEKPINFAKFSTENNKVFYCCETMIFEAKILFIDNKFQLMNINFYQNENGIAKSLDFLQNKENQELVLLLNSNNSTIITYKIPINNNIFEENTSNEIIEQNFTDPFYLEITRIEEFSSINVELLDVNYKKRELIIKVKTSLEIWVILQIQIPFLYPFLVSPIVCIENCAKNTLGQKDDMLNKIEEIIRKSVLCNLMCIKEIIQYVLSELQDPSKYPSILSVIS